MELFLRGRTVEIDAVNRRLVAGLLCSTLLWWAPGSIALGQVAVGATAPTSGGAAPPTSASTATAVALASAVTDDPVVVRRTVTATVGRSNVAAPNRSNRSTTVGGVVLSAYRVAASLAPESCNLDVSLLAAIGQAESGNLAGRRLDADHRPVPPVLGPVLTGGGGFAAIPDTDGGFWDGDTAWDGAVGPFQLLPSTWRVAGVDLDGDGERNPQDIEDAAGAAMVYLCSAGADLSTGMGLRSAIYAYNHSDSYVDLVMAWKNTFDTQGLDPAQGEAPLLHLATAYHQAVSRVDKTSARTAHALRSGGTVGPDMPAAGQVLAKQHRTQPSDKTGPHREMKESGKKPGAAAAGSSPSASPSVSSSSSAGSGPARAAPSASASQMPVNRPDAGAPVSQNPMPPSSTGADAPTAAHPTPTNQASPPNEPTPAQQPAPPQEDCLTSVESTPVEPAASTDPTSPGTAPICPAAGDTPTEAPASAQPDAAATKPTP
jgi:hypothetical protein